MLLRTWELPKTPAPAVTLMHQHKWNAARYYGFVRLCISSAPILRSIPVVNNGAFRPSFSGMTGWILRSREKSTASSNPQPQSIDLPPRSLPALFGQRLIKHNGWRRILHYCWPSGRRTLRWSSRRYLRSFKSKTDSDEIACHGRPRLSLRWHLLRCLRAQQARYSQQHSPDQRRQLGRG